MTHALVFALALAVAQDPAITQVQLRGDSDDTPYRVRLEISVERTVLLRGRWTDSEGRTYSVEAELKPADWDRLKAIVHEARGLAGANSGVSHGVDWTVTLVAGGAKREFAVRGEGTLEDRRYSKLIGALLEARDRVLAFARREDEEPLRQVLLPAVARRRAASLLEADADVLAAGAYVNVEIVDALVALLDRERAAAACGALAWISGRPAADDPAAWKAWWKDARASWAPDVKAPGTGEIGRGSVRALGGGAAGFGDLALGPEGAVWGSADELYRLDGASDAWKPAGPLPKVEASYAPENRLDFLARLARSGIKAPLYHGGLAVSPDGARGVAVVGTDANRHAMNSLAVFEFEKGAWRRVELSGLSVSDPVLNANGGLVAVAEGRQWADPNGVTIYDTSTGRAVATPDIPKAETLFPIAWIGDAVYFYRDDEDQSEEFEVWRYDVAAKKSDRLLAEAMRSRYMLGVRTRIPVTADGGSILVRRDTGPGACRLGLLDLRTKDFHPVSADGAHIERYAMEADGSRVLFLRSGIVFEWRKR